MNANQSFRSSLGRGHALVLLGTLVACAGWLDTMSKAAGEEAPAAGDDLSVEQARLADRYERLEIVIGRLAELSAGTDPRRARLLRDALAESREQDIHQRFETIVSLLEEERLAAAGNNQTELQKELEALLTLLLKTDRDTEMESQARRIRKYLQEVSRLLRLQKGLRARTEAGDKFKPLSANQQQLADQTGKLGGKIAESDGSQAKSGPGSTPADGDKSSGDNADKPSDKSSEGKPADSSKPSPSDSQPSDNSGEGKPADSSKPSQSDGQPSESGDSSPSQPSPSGGRSQPSGGQSGGSQSQQQPSPPQQPTDRAAERLRAAQQRMEQARKLLDEAEREGAAQEQREALKELEQAKAELERVLRQLREEEMERMLTLLAARFRRMLEAQIKVYDGTLHLDSRSESARDHNYEIEGARLSREESLIVREADKSMVLLREEGSSVAFPEAVEQMREDMQQVVRRLADLKVGVITQELEQDIIAALEETIAALEKALRDLDKNRQSSGQMPSGQMTEPPLVDKLAELKMIRSLQMRINRRTQRYGEMIANQDAETPELLEALARLAERQQRVYQATADLSQGRND